MHTIKTHTDIAKLFMGASQGLSVEQVAQQVATSGTPCNMVMRLFRRYASAETHAERYTDLIGVGVISFAEQRLATFQARIVKRFAEQVAQYDHDAMPQSVIELISDRRELNGDY